jgi:hypothetical protein
MHYSGYITIFLTILQMFPRGTDPGKARKSSEIHVWSHDLAMDRTTDEWPLRLIPTPVKA